MTDNRYHKYRAWAPWLLGVAVAVWTLSGLGQLGLTWDEPDTVLSGFRYIQGVTGEMAWKEAWAFNHEHPPAAKVLYGLAAHALPGLSLFDAARMVAALLFGLLVALTFKLAQHFTTWYAGLASAVVVATLPRLVAHAHLAGLDLPMTLAWVLATYCFVRGLESKAWAVGWGLALGLAGLTKVNAPLIPMVLLPWGLIFYRSKALPNLLATLIGPVVFFAGWPWMYFDTVAHFTAYVRTVTERSVVPVYYMGRTWRSYGSLLLSTYPVVMTVLTVPVAWLACMVAGMFGPWRVKADRSAALRWLCAFTLGVVLVMQSLPGTPKYDGIRIFMPIFPFVACLAGMGLVRLVGTLWKAGTPKRVAATAIVLLGVAPAFVWGPWGMSYYNGLIGWSRGAYAAGMDVTYWGEGVDGEVIEKVNELCQRHTGRVPVRFVSVGRMTGAWHYGPDNRTVPAVAVDGDNWVYLVASARRGNFTSHQEVLDSVSLKHIVYTRELFAGTPFAVPLARIYRHP